MRGQINTKQRANASERLRRYSQERSETEERDAKRWEAVHETDKGKKKKRAKKK
jgi:hypothetical protein